MVNIKMEIYTESDQQKKQNLTVRIQKAGMLKHACIFCAIKADQMKCVPCLPDEISGLV